MSMVINGTSGLTFPDGSLQGIGVGRRNLIINGAMQVAQRGALNTDANAYTTVDRFAVNKVTASMTYKDEQVSDAPPGFVYSKKITVTAANTTTTDHRCAVYYMIEGYAINSFKWGTANAENITLSFWVKGSETGTYTVMFQSQNDSGRMYAAPYTIDAANTWEYKTITVPGDTGGDCWGNKTNGVGLQLRFSLGTASSRQITASTWTTGTGSFGATGEKDITTILNATFQITGVQLEVGSVATPFEHRSYGEELALCQRYYEDISNFGATAGARWTTQDWTGQIGFRVTKRAVPTMTYTGTLRTFADGSQNTTSTIGTWALGANGVGIRVTGGAGNASSCIISEDAATITADAEL